MVCLESHSIKLGDKVHKILRVEVWWIVEGKGLYPNLEDALKVTGSVCPAPVAVSENGIYEVLPPIMEKTASES